MTLISNQHSLGRYRWFSPCICNTKGNICTLVKMLLYTKPRKSPDVIDGVAFSGFCPQCPILSRLFLTLSSSHSICRSPSASAAAGGAANGAAAGANGHAEGGGKPKEGAVSRQIKRIWLFATMIYSLGQLAWQCVVHCTPIISYWDTTYQKLWSTTLSCHWVAYTAL